MVEQPINSQAALGGRIAQAREDAGVTQAGLAGALGLDRTAIVKIESGIRRVSATELIAIASTLERPIDWFAFESPAAVVSRRRDPEVGGLSASLDRNVERLGRDVAFLQQQGILPVMTREKCPVPDDYVAAEVLAAHARTILDCPSGPLLDLQALVESAGLLAFALELGDDAGDAAYVEVDEYGVALINGSLDPGRRRFDLAHEFGHHLVGDAYAADSKGGVSGETERMLNVFAAHLLLPRAAVSQTWEEFVSLGSRMAAIAVAARFRVSWSAALSQLRNLNLIEGHEFESLAMTHPRSGDLLAVGERWVAELQSPGVPPKYARRVVTAFRSGKLTASRAVELLHGTLDESDLPDLDVIPIDGWRREFDALD